MHKNVKFIILIYQFFLLFPIFSSEKPQGKLDNNPYITVIYIGNKELFVVSHDSWAKPVSAYKTSAETTNEISYDKGLRKITIKNKQNENNITLIYLISKRAQKIFLICFIIVIISKK